jgi:hypothetical protein
MSVFEGRDKVVKELFPLFFLVVLGFEIMLSRQVLYHLSRSISPPSI